MSNPVHGAAKKGDLSRLRALLEEDPGLVNARDDDGRTPLHWATWGGYTEAAELLHKLGAEVNARDRYGSSPFHWAAERDHSETAELLQKLGAEVNARDNDGETPLHWAVANGQTKAAELLYKLGAAEANARNNFGATPLHMAAWPSGGACRSGTDGLRDNRYIQSGPRLPVGAVFFYSNGPVVYSRAAAPPMLGVYRAMDAIITPCTPTLKRTY
jgi:ankyrin repeat protein